MWVAILVIFLIAISVFHIGVHCSRFGRLINKLPGPNPPIPVLGNLLPFIFTTDNVWVELRRLNKEFFPISRLWASCFPIVSVMHPDDVEVLLKSTKNIKKSFLYDLLQIWFDTGLLTSTGAKWQQRRRLLTPAFHFNILQQYSEIIVEHNERLAKSLNLEDEVVIDVMPFVTKYTLSVICEAAMGTKLHEDENLLMRYFKSVYTFGVIWSYRAIRPWFYNDKLFGLLPMGRRLKKAIKELHDFSSSIIRSRQEYHDRTDGKYLTELTSETSNQHDELSFGSRKKRLAMLDLLIAAQRDGGQITERGIQEEVDTFIFEGHDTTSMSLCFTLLLFAEHKEIQERARAEVDEVLAKYGKLGINELQNCNYLERCIKESLRLYPSVPSIGRVIEHEITLSGHLIPIGTPCFVHIYEVHRDPANWPNPLEFNPDRFLPENIKGRHPYCYIPFSAGPRNCIGQKFAMMELKAFMGTILHNYYLEPIDFAHSTKILLDLVIRPGEQMRVKFIPRKKKL